MDSEYLFLDAYGMHVDKDDRVKHIATGITYYVKRLWPQDFNYVEVSSIENGNEIKSYIFLQKELAR